MTPVFSFLPLRLVNIITKQLVNMTGNLVILFEIVKANYLETATHYRRRPLQKTLRPLPFPAASAGNGNISGNSY